MPCSHGPLSDARLSNALRYRFCRIAALILLLLTTLLPPPQALAAPDLEGAPVLSLPTPRGEPWRIIQGYACGTHNSFDRYALDLVNTVGSTYDAPVFAAADGAVFVWERQSGTLILSHGNGFYTQYTHMQSAAVTQVGAAVQRGQQIGTAGDRGSRGTPHLHFMAFTAEGSWARNRRTYPLSFSEGYSLPEIGGCNQHHGVTMIAGRPAIATAPGFNFKTEAQPGRWYNNDVMIEFGGEAAASGYSSTWGQPPPETAPASHESAGAAHLAEAGEGLHTLYVRAWNPQGQQAVASFGPIGFDQTAPPAPPALAEPLVVPAGQPSTLQLTAEPDNGSGLAGYRVYLGPDPQGTADWFVPSPAISLPALPPGEYILRVQPLDYAGNAGTWATLGMVRTQN
jgi:hypothetical protein